MLPGPSPGPAEQIESQELRDAVQGVLSHLPPRQARALAMRYGIEGDGEPAKFDAIGAALGVSRERARQLCAQAMRRLRKRYHQPLSIEGSAGGQAQQAA
jgi:RNA polymerase primary sigma factor